MLARIFITIPILCSFVKSFSLENCAKTRELFSSRSQETVNDAPSPPIVQLWATSLPPVIKIDWNSTGHAQNVTGFAPYMLDLIAQHLKFKYCWVPLGYNSPFDDTSATKKGIFSLASDEPQNIVLFVGGIVRTVPRYQRVDFTMPIAEAAFSIMIPFPEKKDNNSAFSQPFQTLVWTGLLISIAVVSLSLQLCKFATNSFIEKKTRHFNGFFNDISYVLTVLFGQGSFYQDNTVVLRCIAGSWCLAVCVLIPAYSGILLSFIMSPTIQPLLKSIYDIDRVPGLKVAVDGFRAVDLTLTTAAKDPEYRNTAFSKIAANIQKTIFRCNVSSECADKVLTGNYVYIQGEPAIDVIMIDDLKKAGHCRLAKSRDTFFRGYLHWAVPKNSLFRNHVDKGLILLDASGLSEFWRLRFMKKASKCLQPDKIKPVDRSRLTLRQLSVAFLVLGVGYFAGFCAFLVERLLSRRTKVQVS